MKRQITLLAVVLILAAIQIWIVLPPSGCIQTPIQTTLIHLTPTWVRIALTGLMLWVLPGLAWSELLPAAPFDRTERTVIGLGLNYVIVPLTTLALSYLPGPLARTPLLLAITALSTLPLLVAIGLRIANRAPKEPAATPPATRWVWLWLAAAVLIAASTRFINLYYAEFQGDEGAVIVRAAHILTGD